MLRGVSGGLSRYRPHQWRRHERAPRVRTSERATVLLAKKEQLACRFSDAVSQLQLGETRARTMPTPRGAHNDTIVTVERKMQAGFDF
jgi:hypothetical protein